MSAEITPFKNAQRQMKPVDPDYSVHVRITPGGFDWDVEEHTAESLSMDGLASDMAAIALSLRPQRLSLWQRIRILFTGDPE